MTCWSGESVRPIKRIAINRTTTSNGNPTLVAPRFTGLRMGMQPAIPADPFLYLDGPVYLRIVTMQLVKKVTREV
jgi:hypothetical protein